MSRYRVVTPRGVWAGEELSSEDAWTLHREDPPERFIDATLRIATAAYGPGTCRIEVNEGDGWIVEAIAHAEPVGAIPDGVSNLEAAIVLALVSACDPFVANPDEVDPVRLLCIATELADWIYEHPSEARKGWVSQ